jgi:hypothetical protein
MRQHSSTGATATSTTTNFPASTNNAGNSINITGKTIVLATASGQNVETRDFVSNGVTTEDPQNKGSYYLAGSIGYCMPDGTCPHGAEATDFHVVYYKDQNAFIIPLLSEPLGTARKNAEQFMLRTLGVSEQQLCSLNYQVLTTSYISANYAGQNLGFSFCPGAVQLP